MKKNRAKTPVGDWLDRMYVKWQYQDGNSADLNDFIDYLEISRGMFNKLSDGSRRLTPKMADHLAAKCSDDGIYEAGGLEKPDFRLRDLTRRAESWSPEGKDRLLELADQIDAEEQGKQNARPEAAPT